MEVALDSVSLITKAVLERELQYLLNQDGVENSDIIISYIKSRIAEQMKLEK
jgi:hypothetical protein